VTALTDIRNRLEALIATITMPSGTFRDVADSAPLRLDVPDGTYTFVVDWVSLQPTLDSGIEIITERQTWSITVYAPPVSFVQELIEQADTNLDTIVDRLLDGLVNTYRLALNSAELDKIEGVQITEVRKRTVRYPETDGDYRQQATLTMTIQYIRT